MRILDPPLGKRCLSLSAIFLAAIAFADLSLAQVAEQVVRDGAFAYWTMNETGPGPARNAGADPTESATFPDNAQVEYGVPGLADPNSVAVRFKGFNPADNSAGFMDIADSANTNAGGPWLEKTIELWFSVDDASKSTEQVIYEQGGSTRGMSMYVRNGKVYVGGHNSNADSGGVASPWPAGTLGAGENELAVVSTDIESNTPYHLAMVYQGADAFDEDGNLSGTITGYLNGESFGAAENVGTLYGHTDDIRVGGVAGQTHFDLDYSGATPYGNDGLTLDPPAATAQAPYFFEGVVDDVALYGTALTAEQIKTHFDARDYLPGDFDANGKVDAADFAVLSSNFNEDGFYSEGDLSFNGRVDLEDFSIFRRIFAEAQPAGAAASVPEPGSALLILSGAFALALLRRRSR